MPEGGGPWFPFGFTGVLFAMPFAVWLFLAIEQLPLAAEESHDPKKDMPRGLLLGILTLCISATLMTFLNSGIGVTNGTNSGAFYLGGSGEPLLDGFRAIYGGAAAKVLALLAVIGLIASLAHDHLRLWPADLLAVASRLLPAGAVAHPRHAQSAACGVARRAVCRLRFCSSPCT